MQKLEEAVQAFLAKKRVAVAGVSRSGTEAANSIYKKFKGAGYEVFPVNPNAEEVEGDRCYPDLASIPGGVEAVMIATAPAVSKEIVLQASEAGIQYVWMHRSIGDGSFSDEAAKLGREKGLTVIPAGCPMMFVPPVDFGHKCMKWIFQRTGKIPEAV